MRLLRSEFLRARSRRLVPMVIVAGLLGIVIGLGIAAFYAEKPSAAEVERAQAQSEQQKERCLNRVDQSQLPEGESDVAAFCDRNSGPYLDGFLLRDLDAILQGVGTFVIMLGVLLGASLGGADWTSNTMQTLLTWEPRRARVYLVRALVIAVCVFLITAFLQTVFAGVDVLVAATRGSTALLPGDFWRSVALTIGRVSVIASAFAVIAYAIAMIGRSTVASLGALVGYLILFEAVIAGFRPSVGGSLLVRAAIVIITHQPLFDSNAVGPSAVLLDVTKAWSVVAIYTVAIVLVAYWVFRERDVT